MNRPYNPDFMKVALALAEYAGSLGEVPVGAIVVSQQRIIATGYNCRERDRSPTGHAEMVAVCRAAEVLGSWRLNDCELYVTLEPCLMCAGALYQARIKQVIFGATDPKGGALHSLYQIHTDQRLNHRFSVIGGVMHQESAQLLSQFFRQRRQQSR